MGVKALEMVVAQQFGEMVSFKNNTITSVSLESAVSEYNYVDEKNYLVDVARKMGISFGD